MLTCRHVMEMERFCAALEVALNLDYLISFHGSELVMEPQRLLGSVISALHADPIF